MAPLLCEGPGPQEECPNKAREKSVHVGWGDLNLCGKCNQMRIYLVTQRKLSKVQTVIINEDIAKSGKKNSEETNIVNGNVRNSNDTSNVASTAFSIYKIRPFWGKDHR